MNSPVTTEQTKRSILEAMLPFLGEAGGNPSSIHKSGRNARAAVDDARQFVASFIGVTEREILFAPSATYANNVAILGRARSVEANNKARIFAIVGDDLDDVKLICDRLDASGWNIIVLDEQQSDLEQRLIGLKATGACTHGNFPSFLTTPRRGVLSLPLDSITIGAGGFGSALTAAALVVRSGTNLMPIVFGGGQEMGLFPGTESVAGIVGLGMVAKLATKSSAVVS